MNQLPVNIAHRLPIKYLIITLEQLKNVYNFYEESADDDFLNAVNEKFMPEKEYKLMVMLKQLILKLMVTFSLTIPAYG